MNKTKQCVHARGTYLLLCLSLFAGTSIAQSCDPLTLDSITDPGIYSVATLTESNGLRNGPDYAGATLYYPTNATPPFASIAMVPGFISFQSSIQDWGPFLASHGIVTMTIGTNSLFADPYDRRDALLDAIVTITEENTRSGSPLFGSLDLDKIAVGGWSMGGGGAQLAATADPTLKAVMALCPWLDTQTTAADLDHPVPVLIFSAENDVIAPPAAHADIHYDLTPETTSKLIFEIENADHEVANSPTGGQGYVGKIGLSWLKQFLLDDACYCPLLLDTPSVASNYLTNITCPDIPTRINDIAMDSHVSYQLYPSPCEGSININVARISERTTYEIRSVTGEKVSSGRVEARTTNIDVRDLPPGLYLMNVITDRASEQTKFIVL
ncbi:MAG: T9SS type A sorting domain-containing protein [Flavobacteriales bacterium]|nr:T9SS type A sorting domain-containing protein [Flavobacteriales bacterium]